MECNSVQELRPRASTSGGQSDASACEDAMEAEAVVWSAVLVAFLGLLPVMANQDATSVQVRHLPIYVSKKDAAVSCAWLSGRPRLPAHS
jgi:hypothetical protein